MSGDETYLESFIEGLATLPQELRRNMELMKDLDASCSRDFHKLRQLQRHFINHAEEKIITHLEVAEMDLDENDNGQDEDYQETDGNHENTIRSYRIPTSSSSKKEKAAVPVVQYGVRTLNDDGTTSPDNPVTIPTTEELFEYIYDQHEKEFQVIRKLQRDCLQKADEKVAVAQQAYEMVQAQVQRLDRDLAAMEQMLQATGEFQTGPIAKPNDLAACQLSAGSEWILAKVIEYDPTTCMYRLADEDVESNKIFDLPDSQVIVLTGAPVSKGDVVFAVYPDTTSFYQATVVQAPRKGSTGQFVMVNFMDDSDEFGITHDKAVPLAHIMPPPNKAL